MMPLAFINEFREGVMGKRGYKPEDLLRNPDFT
jgi:hypothetical protein